MPLPVLEEFDLSKSENQRLWCGMGAGVAGARPVRHLLSRCSPVVSAPEVMCVSCARGLCVHSMVVLQAVKITLNMSQRTLWAQCISDHWEEKSFWLRFHSHGWKPLESSVQILPQFGPDIGWCLLPSETGFPATYLPGTLVSCKTYERDGPFLSCCHRCAGVCQLQQVPRVAELH